MHNARGAVERCRATRRQRLGPPTTVNPDSMRRMSPDPAVALPSVFVRRISREEMSTLPIRRYDGPVHVVAAQPDLVHAMQDILQESVLGFDAETRPACRPGECHLPSIAQFATARAVYFRRTIGDGSRPSRGAPRPGANGHAESSRDISRHSHPQGRGDH